MLALVILLGALILLAVGALIAGAYLKLARPGTTAAPYLATLAAPGERIESTELNGNRILLRLNGPSGEELVVVDVGSGRVLGRIAVKSGP
jgi:hypothetical protein